MDLEQFYPTPPQLAEKAWKKFNNRSAIVRLLEPGAGRADLLKPALDSRWLYKDRIDCIEINPENQAILMQNDFNVVGSDFLTFDGGCYYSHIFLNPPFSNGVEHVLKAWDILHHGQVVAIINASTIENPASAKRQFLVKLIEDYGDVEFVDEAFMDPDTKRKTMVRIAIVHLTKVADFSADYLNKLTVESTPPSADVQIHQDLALRGSSIQNTVVAFDVAVLALKQKVIANEEWQHYASRIGSPLDQGSSYSCNQKDRAGNFNEDYLKLKASAWRNILSATEFVNVLSSSAYKSVESQFDQILIREFTLENIYSLLEGLMHSLRSLKTDGMLDVFDSITKYRAENRCFYKGWKSNDKHCAMAWAIKMTRFILPAPGSYWDYCTTAHRDTVRLLRDMDRVFAQLEGKSKPSVGLVDLFDNKETYAALCAGERLSCDYFDVRFYLRAKTIHFFPTNARIVEELNLQVGRLRQWLPNEGEGSDVFWDQYRQAEKVTNAMAGLDNVKDWGWCNADGQELPRHHADACERLNIPLPSLECQTPALALVA